MKVTLLGDSVRLLGYGKAVPDLLGDKFEVFQPSFNCQFAKYTLRGTFDWRKDIDGSDIIHWNNGLWDVHDAYGDGPFTPIDHYIFEMIRVAKNLKKQCKKLIFATTTPLLPGNELNDNLVVAEYNKAIVPELEKMGVIINDLYSFVYPNREKYICDDKIHLSEEGIKACGKEVADFIIKVSKEL